MNHKNKNLILVFLILFILILLSLFYLFDKKKTTIQNDLNTIYLNTKFLNKNFNPLFNKNYKVIRENNIIIIENLLNKEYNTFLKEQFNHKKFTSKDFYLRKASGFDFFKLHTNSEYVGFLELYYSNQLLDILTNIYQKPIQRTPLSDNNACSLLIYSNKGDYIDWHKDYSLYNGDRYVALYTILNENSKKDGLSKNEFFYIYNGKTYKLKMQPNSLILFKGSEIYHKSTSIDDNEKRILLSMTFCDICQEKKNIIQFLYEKIKNGILYN